MLVFLFKKHVLLSRESLESNRFGVKAGWREFRISEENAKGRSLFLSLVSKDDVMTQMGIACRDVREDFQKVLQNHPGVCESSVPFYRKWARD